MKTDWNDLLLLAGGAIIVVGVALIHPPSALIFAGVAIMAFAAIGAWSEARRPPAKMVEEGDDRDGEL
jgi:hypothetical protein